MNRPTQTNGLRQGVILAAGLGSRLADERQLKPLIAVEGISLLLRTLSSLEVCCDRVVIVLGYGAARIQDTVLAQYRGELELHFVVNDLYHLANGVSALAARDHIEGEFILTMADHILDQALLDQAKAYRLAKDSAALLVDYKLESIFDMADATKVVEQNGLIVAIGKELESYNCIDTGVFICTPALLDALQRIYDRNGDVSLSEGVQWLAGYDRMYTIDIGDGFWQDVDTPEMLEYAEKILALKTLDCQSLKN